MPYDPTQYTASILIDGNDLRQAFGLEALTPIGRSDLSFDRREHDLPFKHGVTTQGGKYKSSAVVIQGWMPKANLHKFSRFLSDEDTIRPTRQRGRRSLVFMDMPEVVFGFDTVENFSESEMTKRWMNTTYVNVTFAIQVTGAFPFQSGISDFGLLGPWRWASTPQGVSLTKPGFMNLFSTVQGSGDVTGDQISARTHEDVIVKLGPSVAAPTVISAKTGPMSRFDDGLKMVDNAGVVISGKMMAPTEILTNPNFDGTVTGWTTVGSPPVAPSAVGAVESEDGEYSRIPSGSHVCSFKASNGNGIRQDFTAVAGKQYTVRVEVWATSTAEIFYGTAAGDEELVSFLITSNKSWRFLEFTMEAETSEDYRIRILGNAPNKEIWLNKVSVVESIIPNGSFEGTFTAGLAPSWESTGLTVAEETTTVHSTGTSTARKAQKITRTGANHIRPSSAIALTADRVYYFSGWAYKTAGASGSIVLDSGATSPDNVNFHDEIKLPLNQWVRFGTFFDTFAGTDASFKPEIQLLGTGTAVILDDISLTELTEGGVVQFEPGPFGKRLIVPTGCVAMFEDNAGVNNTYINNYNFALCSHFLPTYPDDMGNMTIMKATRKYGVEIALRWDGDAFGVLQVEDGQDGDVKTYKLDGDACELDAFFGGWRGTRGAVIKYDGTQVLDTGFQTKLFVERVISPQAGGANTSDGQLLQAIEAETDSVAPQFYPQTFKSYNKIFLGDFGYWDAFYSFQYGIENERAAAECVAKQPPAFTNRVFTYGLPIVQGSELIIDLARGIVELFDGTDFTNAMPDVTGSLPEIGGAVPTLIINQDIANMQIIAKATA